MAIRPNPIPHPDRRYVREEVGGIGGNPAVTYFPAVNTFSLAGYTFPGKWTLASAPKTFKWNSESGYGLSGAKLYPVGFDVVKIQFHGEIWRSVDFANFAIIRKQILGRPVALPGGNGVAALGIDHPELKALGITAVVVETIEPAIQEDSGLWTTNLTLLHYTNPIAAPSKPSSVIPDKTATPQQDAASSTDAQSKQLQAELEVKLAQFKAP